jgi:hypothetical protein
MKNTVRLFGTLSFKLCVVVMVAAFCFGLAACDNGTTSSGGNGEETPGKAVDLISVEANSDAPTRTLTLKFSADIENLSKEDIFFSPDGNNALVTAGALSGTGTTRTLGVTALKAGKLTVRVSKDGYRVAGAKTVDVVLAPPDWKKVTLESAVANGSLGADGKAAVTTSKLSFELSEAIPGLTAENVNVGAGVRKGILEKTGEASYSVNISGFGVDAETGVGTLTVSVNKEGYVVEPSKEVTVYVYKRPASGTGTPVGYFAYTLEDVHTTEISLTFGQVVPGLSAENVILSVVEGNGKVIRGDLSQPRILGDGSAVYTLWIQGDFSYGTTVFVDVVKDGYSFSAADGNDIVMLYYFRDSTFGVVAKSGANDEKKTTTVLTLTFGVDPMLEESDVATTPGYVQISGSAAVAGVRITSFAKVGPGVYEVGIAGFAKDGTLTVKATVPGINFNPASVPVSIFYVAEKIDSLTGLVGFLKSIENGEYVTVKIEPPLTLAGVKNAIAPVMLDGKNIKITLDIADNDKIDELTAGILTACPNLYGIILGQNYKAINSGAFTTDDTATLKEIILDAPLFLGTGSSSDPIPRDILKTPGLSVIINVDQTQSLFTTLTTAGQDTSLAFVKFGEGIDTITTGLFKGCTQVTSYTVPESITKIADGAFDGCSALATLVVEDELVSIGNTSNPSKWPDTLINLTLKKSPAASVVFPKVKVVTLEGDANVVKGNFAVVGGGDNNSIVTDFTLNGTEAPVFGDFELVENITVGTDYSGTLTGSTFNGLAALEAINVLSTNKSYKSVSDVLISFDGTTLIKYPQKMQEGDDISMPAVTIIGESAFKGSKATGIDSWPSGLTTIRANAFEDSKLEAVAIPNTVTSIGKEAFKGCTEIDDDALEFTATSKVATIGDSAFEGCTKIEEVEIPASVETLGTGVFAKCTALATVVIEAASKLETIPASTFEGDTSLATVTINTATKITSIGASAFADCDSLTGFVWPATTVSGTVQNVSIADNAFYSGTAGLATITIGGKLVSLGTGALPANCAKVIVQEAVQSGVKFPATVTEVELGTSAGSVVGGNFNSLIGVKITLNRAWATKAALATSLSTLSGITSLGIGTSFSITGGSSTTLVGSDFDALTSLSEITAAATGYSAVDGVLFSDTTGPVTKTLVRYPIAKTGATYDLAIAITNIGTGAFKNVKNLTTITATASPQGLKVIAEGAFVGSKLQTVSFGDAELTSISATTPPALTTDPPRVGAFENVTSLKSIAGLGGIIGYNTFKGCTKLQAEDTVPVTLTTVTSILDGAFMGCNAAVVQSGDDANKGFIKIVIPLLLTSIGKNAFNGCSELATLTFTAGVDSKLESIGEGAFAYTKIASVAFTGTDPTKCALTTIGALADPDNNPNPVGAFEGATELVSVSFSGETANLVIGSNTFKGCEKLKAGTALDALTLTGATTIGSGAFYGCKSTTFTTMVIPATVTAIGDDAFRGCESLVTLTPGTGLRTVGNGAFVGTKLATVTFQDGLTGIGTIPTGSVTGAFEGVTDLETVNLGTVGTGFIIGKNAFKGCTKLNALDLDGVVSIGASAFESCNAAAASSPPPNGFTKVTLPSTLTTIGNRAFAATSLVELTLGASFAPTAANLGSDIFASNTALKQLVLNASLYNNAIASKLPVTNFDTVTLGISQGGFNFSGFTALETVNVELAAGVTTPVAIVNGNFGTVNTIKKVDFKTAVAHTVAAGSFNSAALTSVVFGTGVDSVVIAGPVSFPMVVLEEYDDDYFMTLKDAYGAGVVGTYELDRTKGWKKNP